MIRVGEHTPVDVLGLSGAEKNECIMALWRGASRFHFASLQDKNPVVAARHNGYAVALIDALRDIASEEEVRKVTGESARKLRSQIIAIQDKLEGEAIELLEMLKKRGISIPGF